MSCQKLMLFSLILTMFLFGVACGETDQVSPDSADPSAKAESIAQEEAVDPAAEPELPSEAESKAGQTIAQPEEAETGGVNGDRVVEPGSGMIIADTGFRPETNGFSFPNFGADVNADNELTGFIVWDIFGDVVCSRIADDECEPTPAAQLWVKTVDRARAGGHCEGLAALSAALFRGEFSPEEDFGISTASELALSNDVLDQISEEWMIQAIEPVASETARFRQMSPTEILDVLTTSMNDESEFFTMGLYGPNGGHSLTPYKIEELDSGIVLVYAYDSNYPGAEKFVEFDTTNDTWRYAGGALDPADDPAPWTGGRGSMDLTPTWTRFESLECPFCGRSGDRLENKILVLLNGKGGRVSAVNGKNKRVAMGAGNSEVNEIPGSKVVRMKGNALYNDDRNWLMILPADAYTITVTGETNETTEATQVAIFQPGRSYVVDDINLDPGQEDRLMITGEGQFSYMAGDDETPRLELGTDEVDGLDGLYMISGAELSEGYSFTIAIDEENDTFAFFEDDPDLETFDLEGFTVNAEGLQNQFSFDDVFSGDNDQAMFELEDDADFISLGLDEDMDGDIDLADTDGDGILDSNEPDTDGDGVSDDLEDCDYILDNEIPDCDDAVSNDDDGSDEENLDPSEDEIVDDQGTDPDGDSASDEEVPEDEEEFVDDQGGDVSDEGGEEDGGDGGDEGGEEDGGGEEDEGDEQDEDF